MNELADILSKIGQFLIGLFTLLITLYAVFVRWTDLFKTELKKRQFDEVEKIRAQLHIIAVELYNIPFISDEMTNNRWNFDSLRINDPESWQQYHRYKRTSTDIFYKFFYRNYYLIPEKWISIDERIKFRKLLEEYAPFTIISTMSKNKAERGEYLNELLKMINHIDVVLSKHG